MDKRRGFGREKSPTTFVLRLCKDESAAENGWYPLEDMSVSQALKSRTRLLNINSSNRF